MPVVYCISDHDCLLSMRVKLSWLLVLWYKGIGQISEPSKESGVDMPVEESFIGSLSL